MFSRTMTMSTPWKREGTPGRFAHRPQVRVEVEGLAQSDVDAREPLADRRRDRALQGDAVGRHRVEQRLRQRAARLLHGRDAGVVLVPLDDDASRLDDAHDGGADLRPDAVSGNERDPMSHLHAIIGPCPPSTGSRGTRPHSSRRSAAAVRSCSCSRRRGRRPARAHTPRCSRAPMSIAAVADTTVPVRVDADLRPDIGDRYGLGHWPSLLVLTPEGHVLTGGTHLHDALAARIRDAARAFAAHGGLWPSPLPVEPPDPTDLDDADGHRRVRGGHRGDARSRDRRVRARRQAVGRRRPLRAGARDGPRRCRLGLDRPPTPSTRSRRRTRPRRHRRGGLRRPMPMTAHQRLARLEDQAEWVRVLARAVRLEPLPAWTDPARPAGARPSSAHSGATTGTGGRGPAAPRSSSWMRAHGPVVPCSPPPTRSTARISPARPSTPSRSWRRRHTPGDPASSHAIADGHARGPVLLDDAMLLAHALLDADAWRDDPVYRDLAEELVRTSLARLQEPSGAIRDRVAALAGAGQVGPAGRAQSSDHGQCRRRATPAPALPRRRRARRGGPPHPRAR